MRLLVCGGRNYSNVERIAQVLGDAHLERQITVLIEGGARGADRLCREWALAHDITVQTFHADWKAFGTYAGPERNQRMLDQGRPDLLIAFPGGHGTLNMTSKARKAGVPVSEVAL